MIASLRAVRRALISGIYLFGWTAVHAIARPFCRGERAESWRRRFLGGACRGLLRIAGIHVRTEGPRPRGPGVLVTNHLGYLDVLVLASVLDAVFVSRADVQRWPVIGPLTRWSGTVYIDRERRTEIPSVVEAMRGWVARGVQVVFFPEGTSGPGDALLPFRSSLFESAIRTGARLRCAALSYTTAPTDPPAREAVSWWGDMEFVPHLWRLLHLERVEATLRFAPEPVEGDERKATARRAQALVQASLDGARRAESMRS